MLKGNAESNERSASLLKVADGLLNESKKGRERARVLAEGGRATFSCHDLSAQERAEQDDEFRLGHEDKEDSRLSCKLSSGEGGVEGRGGS